MAGKLFDKQSLQAWTVGLHMVLSTFVGLAMGYGLDSLFHTSPWLTLIFLFLGIIAGFKELFKMAKKQNNGPNKKDI